MHQPGAGGGRQRQQLALTAASERRFIDAGQSVEKLKLTRFDGTGCEDEHTAAGERPLADRIELLAAQIAKARRVQNEHVKPAVGQRL